MVVISSVKPIIDNAHIQKSLQVLTRHWLRIVQLRSIMKEGVPYFISSVLQFADEVGDTNTSVVVFAADVQI